MQLLNVLPMVAHQSHWLSDKAVSLQTNEFRKQDFVGSNEPTTTGCLPDPWTSASGH